MTEGQKTFFSISDACRLTGISMHYLRIGCKSGTIPHIMTGTKYLINVPALLETLDRQSRENGKAGLHEQ